MLWIRLLFTFTALVSVSLPAEATKRAIVIGFSEYSWKPLPGVAIDAPIVTKLLSTDYKITVIDDKARDKKEFRKIWNAFVQSIEDKDEVVVYYAGHAIDVDGMNYLLPLDAPKPTGAESLQAISEDFLLLRRLVVEIQERTPAISFWVIDACRDNPYANLRGATKQAGISREMLRAPVGYYGKTVLFFSADFGQSALDSIPPGNQKLLEQIPDSDRAQSPFAVAFSSLYPTAKSQPLQLYMQYVANLTSNLASPHNQTPQPQGFPPNDWCLVMCKDKTVQISMSTTTGSRTAFDSRPVDNTALSSAPELSDLKQRGNVVFIGKLSQERCTGSGISNDSPFGCSFLKRAASIARGDGVFDPSELSPATALVDVNIRRSSPRISGDDIINDCRVSVLRSGKSVALKGVAAYSSTHLGDTLLFGVLDRDPEKRCTL